ncbi:FUSC family protein [Manganibacter manganicus]|uniref:Fusaric acid resistance protein n=1 Tax=Manganibacter manganicus TaxID=1873176 RepID=A0A1V8RS54_9HYPH|nr:FUSC family protein [Pseudaminobacter manganicus]OQM75968.1 fusaric acid resistance protein [Pseudaminobacter manganicus]
MWERILDRLGRSPRALISPTRSDWVFALRTTCAGLIALLAAYLFKLEHPQWAMMTVFIVAQPVAGMVLAKGFYRLIGTLAGAIMAVALATTLGAYPWVFIVVLSLWIGLCTFISSLLRNPEAYGAALAGYTATIVGLPAFGHPHLIFDLATARCAEIAVGIVCAGITSRLFLPQLARDAMSARLKRCIIDLASYAASAFGDEDTDKLDSLHRKLLVDAQALNEMRTYARLEAPSLTGRAHPVRRTIGYLLSALSTARILHAHKAPDNKALLPVRRELRQLVKELAETSGALNDVRPWIARFEAISAKAHDVSADIGTEGSDKVGTLTRLSIAGEFADTMKEVLRGLDALNRPAGHRPRDRRQPALVIYRDYFAAWRNAVRAAIATLLVAVFWLETQWTPAADVVIIVAVVASLFAPRPSPVQVAWGFFKGTVLALPFAFVVGQVATPVLPGIGWFILLVVPVLLPAALAMTNPRIVGVATAFAINFLVFLNPYQAMGYHPFEFMAGAASILIGILLAIGVYLVVLPANPLDTARRIAQAMREDLVRLCLRERIPRRSAFESLAYDRINQLMPQVQRLGSRGDKLFGGAVASVTVGLEILRLRKLQQTAAGNPDIALPIADYLKRLARAFLMRASADSWSAAITRMREESASMGATRDSAQFLQFAASLRVIAAAIEAYPSFFRKHA